MSSYKGRMSSPLRKERRAAHALDQELVLVLDGVLLLRAREYLPEPLLLILVHPIRSGGTHGLFRKSAGKKRRENPRLDWTKAEGAAGPRGGPGVEVGGEVDEGLRGAAEGLEDVAVVDGKGVGGRHAAPLRRLVLHRLHPVRSVSDGACCLS
jgi:hypothetical protein